MQTVQTVTIKITDAELHTALDVLAAWRDAALSQRGAANLPPVLVNNGQAEPGGTDGDILRVGSLLAKLQGEAMKHELLTDEAEEWPADPADLSQIADLYERYPLPASLTEPLSETARKVNAAIDAGDTVDGETFLAEMRRLSGRA